MLVDGAGNVIAGHGRLEAAKFIGLAEKTGWDDALLSLELQFLVDSDLDFVLQLTGFEMGGIDVLLPADKPDKNEVVEAVDPAVPVVSRKGDLWLIGHHRIFCGNSLIAADWKALMKKERAQMVFKDPSYERKLSDENAEIADWLEKLTDSRRRWRSARGRLC